MPQWTTRDMDSQQDRIAVVTGTGGIGYETALALSRAGAEVILAGRDPLKGAASVDKIRAAVSGAKIRFEQLDLADLVSITAFAHRLHADEDRIDLLVNNAGVMTPPTRITTRDGFELQLGTNYLGHFALTAHLLPLLRRGKNPRVVSLGSVAARTGKINFGDLNSEKAYRPMIAYSQSKLACVMFAFELQRRSDAQGWGITSIAAHPGVSRTELLHNAPGRWDFGRIMRSVLPFLFQPPAQGALPVLFAATAAEVVPGGYYGPDRLSETRGHPAPAKIPTAAEDTDAAAVLWAESETMTGATFDI